MDTAFLTRKWETLVVGLVALLTGGYLFGANPFSKVAFDHVYNKSITMPQDTPLKSKILSYEQTNSYSVFSASQIFKLCGATNLTQIADFYWLPSSTIKPDSKLVKVTDLEYIKCSGFKREKDELIYQHKPVRLVINGF